MPENNCPLYNKGLYIEKVSQTDARVSMCCFQNLSSDTFQHLDFLNNDYLYKLRNKLKPLTECRLCFENERYGNQSYRQGQIKIFEQEGLSDNSTVELVSFLYNCENVCNLKCVTCGPRYSSLWKPEYEKLGYPITEIKTSGNKNTIYTSLDLSKVRIMHFQGGEPLLTDDHENILRQIKTQGALEQLTVSYNTNATVYPSQSTIDLWKQAKLVKLYFSIDGVGDQFEYLRYPGNWKQVEENMFKIRDLNLPNMWIEIGVTVGIGNLFYLQDIVDWRNSHFSKLNNGDPINLYMNFVLPQNRGGEALALSNMNSDLRVHAFEYLKTLHGCDFADPIRDCLRGNPRITTSWEKYLNDIDSLRKTSWKNSLKKLYEHSQETMKIDVTKT